MQIRWDCKGLIKAFGGCQRLQTNMHRHGIYHPVKTVMQWHWRDSIPAQSIAEIHYCIEDDGLPINITDFIKVDQATTTTTQTEGEQ